MNSTRFGWQFNQKYETNKIYCKLPATNLHHLQAIQKGHLKKSKIIQTHKKVVNCHKLDC